MPGPDPFDQMLKEHETLLPKFRREHQQANCMMTAEAVWKYFKTGKVAMARPIMDGFVAAVCSASREISLPEIKRTLLRLGHGHHAVVTKEAGTELEHNINVANIRGKLYYIDAFIKPPIFSDNLDRYMSGAKTLQLSMTWNLHVLPTDSAKNFRCPPQ